MAKVARGVPVETGLNGDSAGDFRHDLRSQGRNGDSTGDFHCDSRSQGRNGDSTGEFLCDFRSLSMSKRFTPGEATSL